MGDNVESEKMPGSAAAHHEQRRLCLEHARDLIASAERVLGGDNAHPNIAYHLGILALEEIGKAGMISARAVGKKGLDASWIEKRLDDHVWKLMWAIWSPSLLTGEIDPKSFEEARRFAESTHARRMAGLYVDYAEGSASVPPRYAVSLDHAMSVVNLSKTLLDLETAKGARNPDEGGEDLEWFLATVNDELGQRRLFSQPFIQKHQEFGGNTREWVRWARGEFAKVAESEKEHLQRELTRQSGEGKPKWLMKVRLQTPSHSLRQKTLNFWNDRIEAVKLRTAGTKNNDLLLEMTLNDHVKVDGLFDFGLAFSKLHIVVLNIGTAGFFWYEISGQTEAYYESIQDLGAPHMKLAIGRLSGLPAEWSENLPGEKKRRRVPMEEAHLNIAMMGLGVFGSMPNEEAEPIFGQYLSGLTLLSKTDMHLSLEGQARDAFLKALRRAMYRFGDLQSEDADLLPALHLAMATVIPEEAHRDQVFAQIEAPGNVSIGGAVAAKRAADLYLALVARRLWPQFVKGSRDDVGPANSRA
jgi:AbiV family abortive infection protein